MEEVAHCRPTSCWRRRRTAGEGGGALSSDQLLEEEAGCWRMRWCTVVRQAAGGEEEVAHCRPVRPAARLEEETGRSAEEVAHCCLTSCCRRRSDQLLEKGAVESWHLPPHHLLVTRA